MRRRGIVPKVQREAAQEAFIEFRTGKAEAKPWEKTIAARNELERKRYQDSARQLREQAAKEADAALKRGLLHMAFDLEEFAHRMPKPKTRRQALIEREVKKRIEKTRMPDRGAGMEL